jgi:predicted nucleic acid-binding protein
MSNKILICDAGVISRFLGNEQKFVVAILEAQKTSEIAITTTVKIELYRWIYDYKSLLTDKRFKEILAAIEDLPVLEIDKYIARLAEDLGKRYYHIGVGDILTAATSINKDLEIFTINIKHFKPIKGVYLYTPPNF